MTLNALPGQPASQVVSDESATAENTDPVNLYHLVSNPAEPGVTRFKVLMEYLPDWLYMQDLPAYLILGMAAGMIAGLLGVGGGLLIVPVLIWVYSAKGFDGAIVAHLAVGTSLATIVATSISSVYAHHHRGAVRWSLVGHLLPGILIGALLGAAVADSLPAPVLKRAFGLFAIAAGVRMLLDIPVEGRRELPKRLGLGFAGGVIGLISAIIGIGGGAITVPFLTWRRVGMRQAAAASSACGLPIALAGGLGFVVTGWNEHGLPPGSSGFVYWPAVLGITVASVLFAPLGAHLAHSVPVSALKKIFALLLLLIGGKMLF